MTSTSNRAIGCILLIMSTLYSRGQTAVQKGNNNVQQNTFNLYDEKDPAEHVDDGFAFYMVIETAEELKNGKRKYVFDFGTDTTKNRLSLYLDGKNNLIYRIIDNEGETFSVKVTAANYTFNPKIPFFIYCDWGFSTEISFMRLWLNNKMIGESKYSIKINFMKKTAINQFSIKMGKDISGNNYATFGMYEFVVLGKPIRKDKIVSVWEEVNKYYHFEQ